LGGEEEIWPKTSLKNFIKGGDEDEMKEDRVRTVFPTSDMRLKADWG
jgi:hypothetical protein